MAGGLESGDGSDRQVDLAGRVVQMSGVAVGRQEEAAGKGALQARRGQN